MDAELVPILTPYLEVLYKPYCKSMIALLGFI